MKPASLSATVVMATMAVAAQPAPPGEFAELDALARAKLISARWSGCCRIARRAW